ncbi:hypothetical protein [Criblamydia sequanensis]|uniref:Membrane protein n=1 Tax=Candidatus Criblamydia sequanensis CRIB-18 TaxID=1437425 RepID=A0A090D161_9BACT|nr:hypothetical protein [Criblamydia sequanensis]CDR33348.1 putative membrane protein [Criblamydia sequanensis CRIB-18]
MHNVGSSAPASIPFQGVDPVDEKKEAREAQQEPKKVEGFANQFFKSIMSLAGFVAISLGAVFCRKLITDMSKDQKKEGLSAEFTSLGKSVIDTLAAKAQETFEEVCPAKPLPPEVFSSFVKWQKSHEANDILYS